MPTATPTAPRHPNELSRPVRWALVGAGMACVALATLGVVVPGLPTTVFLILATWCFTRSCPVLERKLIRENPVFRPFLKYLAPGTRMPRRIKALVIAVMWTAVILSSATIVAASDAAAPIVVGVALAAVVGSVVIIRWRASEPASP